MILSFHSPNLFGRGLFDPTVKNLRFLTPQNLKFCRLFQGKSWGIPGVTHLLFQQHSSMRVTSASYSCSLAVFTLASREMAV